MDGSERFDYIKKGFEAYEKIVDKDIRFIYEKNDKYEEIVLKAKKNNFMHLCGVKYKNPENGKYVSGAHFYYLIKSNKISTDFLEENPDGTTNLKLEVIGYLDILLSGKIRIIDEHIVFLNSSFQGAIRTSKRIFALGLHHEKKFEFGPTSLMNLKTAKDHSFKNSYKVHKVYYKKRNEEQIVFFESDEYKKSK